MPKGGSILANFRLRKMEQNAVAARAAAQQRRNEESQAYMLQEQRERNEWAAEQETRAFGSATIPTTDDEFASAS